MHLMKDYMNQRVIQLYIVTHRMPNLHGIVGLREDGGYMRPIMDIQQQDQHRVQLLLDIDRDYTSFYRLTVDHRGWTREECFGDVAWNPSWYVAADRDRTQWTIEAAIPLSELVREVPSSRAVWAMGIQRVVPGVGFQAWNSPADVEVIPEGFGLLFFE